MDHPQILIMGSFVAASERTDRNDKIYTAAKLSATMGGKRVTVSVISHISKVSEVLLNSEHGDYIAVLGFLTSADKEGLLLTARRVLVNQTERCFTNE